MLRWIKCRPLFLKIFHSFEHCIISWWAGPDLNLYCLKVMIANQKMHLNFDIWTLRLKNDIWLICWTSSEESMKSYVKNSYLLQFLLASWLFGFLMCWCKKAANEQIKTKKSKCYVTTFIEPNLKTKNKNELEKSNNRFLKDVIITLIAISTFVNISINM